MSDRKHVKTSRQRILDAADELVRETGAGRLTLEAVAERAGLSKGGLLYNFPNKDALLQGMIARMMEEYFTVKASLRPSYADRRNIEVRLSVATSLKTRTNSQEQLACGILAASSENPTLLEPVREAIAREWRKVKETAEDPDAAILAWLAIEGLTNLEMHRLSPFDENDRSRLLAAIDRLLDHGVASVTDSAAPSTAPSRAAPRDA